MSKKVKKIRFKKESLCSGLKSDGSEICDSKPTELHMKMTAPVTMRQKMKSLWKEFQLKQEESGQMESLEDAGDFDVNNDEFPKSPYETEGELKHALQYVDEDIKEAVRGANINEPPGEVEAEGGIKGDNDEAN